MKSTILLFVIGLVLFGGCKINTVQPDITPPSSPKGLYTFPGDGYVEVHWQSNREQDLAGYNVYSSTSLNGTYVIIGTTKQNSFVDTPVHNGVTYYYTVTAFDFDNNESDPGKYVVYETPRPEGYGVHLMNYVSNPDLSGYDFSTNSIGPYDDKYTDIFYEYSNGQYYMNVHTDSDIQDMGFTNSLYTIGDAPTDGWSPTKDVQLIPGHTYVVWTWDNHYAKFRVLQLSSSSAVFDWVYQLQEGNPRLAKTTTDRKVVTMGKGFTSRHQPL